jgi:hypothetical protein
MAQNDFSFTGDMDTTAPRAIRRILLPTAWLGLVAAVCAWVYLDWHWALGFVGGIIVGALNLIFLTLLTQQVLVQSGKRNMISIASIVAIKLVLVYGGLAALIMWKLTPTVAVVCGFSLILLVITLKAVGKALVTSGLFGAQSDQRPKGEQSQ